MIIINVISGEEKKIVGEEQLHEFLDKYDNAKDIYVQMLSWHNKGERVYWTNNPYAHEIHDLNEILIGLDKEYVENRFYILSEEI